MENKEEKPPHGGEKKITVTVSYNGANKPLQLNPNQAMPSVLAHAFELYPTAPRDYVLYMAGGPLPSDGSVEAARITEGAVLLLRAPEVRGG